MSGNDIRFECVNCHRPLSIDSEAAGMKIKCPDCGTVLTVPAPPEEDAGIPDGNSAESEALPEEDTPVTSEPVYAQRNAEASDFYRYDVFISYRHLEPDRSWAQWIHTALETYRVPHKLVKERGFPRRIGRVFRDEDELPASADLNHEIAQALKESRFLLVVCSPNTPESEWVNGEVAVFRELGRHNQILALLIEGEPVRSFPRSLIEIRRTITDEAGLTKEEIEEVEPLAADVRPTRKEPEKYLKRMAKLRLLACILGCRFDDLRQRELERRKRYVAWGAAAAVAALLVLGGMGYSIRVQMSKARRHQDLAIEAQSKIEHEKEIARLKDEEARLAQKQAEIAREKARIAEKNASLAVENADMEHKSARQAEKKSKATSYALIIQEARNALKNGDRPIARELLKKCSVNLRGWEWGYLKRFADNEIWIQYLQSSFPGRKYACFVNDNAWIACCGENAIYVLNAQDGKVLFRLENSNQSTLRDIQVTRDKRYLVAIGDNYLKAWKMDTQKELGLPHGGALPGAQVDLDANLFGWISGSEDGVTVWSLDDNKAVFFQEGHRVRAIAFRPQRKQIAIASASPKNEPVLAVYDLTFKKALGTVPIGKHHSNQPALQYSSDGKTLCFASKPNLVLLDAQSGRTLASFNSIKDLYPVRLSPDNKLLACLSDNRKTLIVLETQTMEAIFSTDYNYNYSDTCAFSGNSKTILIAGSRDMAVWDIKTAQRRFLETNLKCEPYGNPLNEDGTQVAYVTPKGKVVLCSLLDKEDDVILSENTRIDFAADKLEISGLSGKVFHLKSFRTLNVTDYGNQKLLSPLASSIRAMCLSRDGRILSYAGVNSITILNLLDGRKDSIDTRSVLASIRTTGGMTVPPRRDYLPGTEAMALDSLGKRLAVGHGKRVTIWDLNDTAQAKQVGFPDDVVDLAFHPKREWLAVGLQNSLIELWDCSGETVIPIDSSGARPLGGSCNGVAFTPDGEYLAAAAEHQLYVWNLESRKLAYQIPFAEELKDVISDGMGRRWITGEKDGISFLDVESGQMVMRLAQRKPVYSLAMDESGRFLAAVDYLGNIHLRQSTPALHVWDIVETKKSSVSRKAVLSPDGQLILTGEHETGIHLFSVQNPDDRVILCPSNGCKSINSLSFSPDSKQAMAAFDNKLCIWDTDTATPKLAITNTLGQYSGYHCSFATNTNRLFLATDKEFGLIKRQDGTWITRFDWTSSPTVSGKKIITGSDNYAALMNDGEKVSAWNLQTGSLVFSFNSTNQYYRRNIILSPDGGTLAMGYSDSIRIVGIPSGRHLMEFAIPEGSYYFRYNGRNLAVSQQKEILIYNATTGSLVKSLPTTSNVLSMDWGGAGGNWLTVVLYDGIISVYNLESCNEN